VDGRLPASAASQGVWNFAVGSGAALFEKLDKTPTRLRDVARRIYQGPITSADTVYLFKKFRHGKRKQTMEVYSAKLEEWVQIELPVLKRVVRSGDIHRYDAMPAALVLFPYEVRDDSARLYSPREMQRLYPAAWHYLNRNKSLLQNREKGKFRDADWYRFGRTQNLGMWEQPKLLVPYMVKELSAYLDLDDKYYFINVTTGGYGLVTNETLPSLPYLCALLNSRLLDFYLKKVSTTFHGGYFAANKQFIEQLPIRPINFSDPADKARHDRMVALVGRMLELNKQRARLAAGFSPAQPEATGARLKAGATSDLERLEREIAATDTEIDELVYELYGITDEERKVIEGT
jgi:hypothetical protein